MMLRRRPMNAAGIMPPVLFFVCLVLFLTTADFVEGKSNTHGPARHCSTDPDMPSLMLSPDQPCDPSTNCRHGGICWKSRSNSTTFARRRKWMRPGEERCRCTMHCDNYPVRSRTNPELNHVCGSDGRTYESECHVRLAACRCQWPVSVMWIGSCEKGPHNLQTPSLSPFDTHSGSGSGDVTSCVEGVTCRFGAVCDVDNEDGPCLCRQDCEGTVPETVCGTDDNSYYNECYLKERACQEQRDIQLKHTGPCSQVEATVTTTTAPNPCEGIFCIHGACVPIGRDDFECSCDAVCDEDAFLVQKNSLSRFGRQSIRQLGQLLPDFRSRYYDDVQLLGLLPTTGTSPGPSPTPEKRPVTPRPRRPSVTPWDDAIPHEKGMFFGEEEDFGRSSGGALPERSSRRAEERRSRRRRQRRQKRVRNSSRHRLRRPKRSSSIHAAPPRQLKLINETVCGTDGKTYRNECQLRVHACYEKKSTKVNKVGACPIHYKRTTEAPITTKTKPAPSTDSTTQTLSTNEASTEKPVAVTSPQTATTTETQVLVTTRHHEPLQRSSLTRVVMPSVTPTKPTVAPSIKSAGSSSDNAGSIDFRKPWVIGLAAVLQITILALVASFVYRWFAKRFGGKQNNNNNNTIKPVTRRPVRSAKAPSKGESV